MSPPPDLDALSSGELKALVLSLLARVSELEQTVVAQRDEIARLKRLAGRPTIKPSGMEKATQPQPSTGKGKRRRVGGKKTARRTIHEDRLIKACVPTGSRFKGYEDFVVQDSSPKLESENTVLRPPPPPTPRRKPAQNLRFLAVGSSGENGGVVVTGAAVGARHQPSLGHSRRKVVD